MTAPIAGLGIVWFRLTAWGPGALDGAPGHNHDVLTRGSRRLRVWTAMLDPG